MKIFNTVIAAFVFFGSIYAEVLTFDVQDKKAQQAIKELYNMNYTESNRLFQEILEDEPFHPLAPIGAVATQWLYNQQREGYEIGNKKLLDEIGSALNIYKRQIIIQPDNAELPFYYGTTMGLKSRILLAEKNWVGVLISGYNCMRYIKKSEKLNSEFWDVYLPLGVFNYYVGISASYMKVASWIMRELGSKEEGLKQMTLSARNNGYGRYEARGILAFVYLYMEDDYIASLEFSTMLADEFPANPYYHFLSAEALISLNQYKEADMCIDKIRNLLPTLKDNMRKEYILKLHLLDGSTALYKKDLITAERELKSVIDSYDLEMDWHLSYAYMRLGNVYDLLGKREEAVECYMKAVKLNNRSSACKWSKKYLKEPYLD